MQETVAHLAEVFAKHGETTALRIGCPPNAGAERVTIRAILRIPDLPERIVDFDDIEVQSPTQSNPPQ